MKKLFIAEIVVEAEPQQMPLAADIKNAIQGALGGIVHHKDFAVSTRVLTDVELKSYRPGPSS